VAAICICALLLSACVGKKEEDPWLHDRAGVNQAIQQINDNQLQLEQRLADQAERIAELEQTIQTQRAQINSLSNSIDIIRHGPKKKKPVTPEPATAASGQAVKSVAVAAGNTPAETPHDMDDEQVKNAYTAAYLSLKSLRYDEATTAFRDFIRQHPNSIYTDQAWFWLGESLYNRKQWNEALQAYHIVASDYPKSVKHAAALLKVALLYRHEGKNDEARAILQRLLREHPDSDVASNAHTLLTSMQRTSDNDTAPARSAADTPQTTTATGETKP